VDTAADKVIMLDHLSNEPSAKAFSKAALA